MSQQLHPSQKLHEFAQQWAIEAEERLRSGDTDGARFAYDKAADYERWSLGAMRRLNTRTASIIRMSAVSLLWKAGRFKDAQILGAEALAEAVRRDDNRSLSALRGMLLDIWDADATGEVSASETLELSLSGVRVGFGSAPPRLVARTLKVVSRAVEEFSRDHPDAAIPRMFTPKAGSLRIQIRLASSQLGLFAASGPYRSALALLVEFAGAAAESDKNRLRELAPALPDRLRRLRRVRDLAPTPKSVARVDLELRSGTGEPDVHLYPMHRAAIRRLIEQEVIESDELELLEGHLRMIDLERECFGVLQGNATSVTRVSMRSDQHSDVAELLDGRVLVTASRVTRPLQDHPEWTLVEIERADDEPQ